MYIDIKDIAAKVSIQDAADFLDLQIVATSKSPRAKCPCCDSDRAIALYPESNTFYCWSRRVGGDSVSLVAHVREIANKEAAEQLAEHMGLLKTQKAAERGYEPPGKAFDPLKYQQSLQTEHTLLDSHGITPGAAREWGIGVSPKGTHAGKVVVPLYKAGKIDCYVAVEGIALPKHLRAK